MTETKSGKSFRAAADRIVRQESSAPSIVSRLLGAPLATGRQPRSDADAWSIRVASLATLGRYDALAIDVSEPHRVSEMHNFETDPAADQSIRGAIETTRRSGETALIRVPVTLVDGRSAGSLLIAPIAGTDAVGGVLVAARVGRSFATADAMNAHAIGELISLEVARDASIARDAGERRQALALYELGRLALLDESNDRLRSAVTIITGMLDHDLARVWLLRSTGSLQLWASHPEEVPPQGIVRPRDHGVLSEVLVQRRVVRVDDPAPDPWVPSDAKSLIVAPLGDRARPVGLLVLGRTGTRYRHEDEDFAGALGSFLASLASVTGASTEHGLDGLRSHLRAEWPEEREAVRG